MREGFREFVIFGLKQARACVFAASFFAVLLLSKHLRLGPLPRYDFIFLAAVAIQVALVLLRLETVDELKVICLFHLVGLALELFKTSPGIASWSYPEPGLLKILRVPVYSGFMYAAVGSYMCQAWRILSLELRDYPRYRLTIPLCVAVYANFFTHHWLPDARWALIALVFVLFARTRVLFTVTATRRRMPLAVAFLLIGFFIWVAENISTYLGAWAYPNQMQGWHLVASSKITSWFLLVIISFIIVADLKHFKERRAKPAPGLDNLPIPPLPPSDWGNDPP